MKIVKNYTIQKNLSFIGIILIGFNYLFLLAILLLKVLPAILMQLILIADIIKNKSSILPLISSIDTYTTWVAFSISILLCLKLINAVRNSFKVNIGTNIFLNGLRKTEYKEDTFLVYSENFFVFAAGIFHPKVYISEGLLKKLNNKELESIRLHELYHVKTYDPLRKFTLDFISSFIPPFPFKKALFNNYEVLTELSADKYSEDQLGDKLGIISSLVKMIDLKNSDLNFNISSFSLKNERIKILVGKATFQTKYFFIALFGVISFFSINTLILSNTNIFTQCEHIVECFQTLFSKSNTISVEDKSMCMSSDSYSSKFHCVKFAQEHSSISSSMSQV